MKTIRIPMKTIWIIQIVLIVLKLLGLVALSWGAVLVPFWIIASIFVCVLVLTMWESARRS